MNNVSATYRPIFSAVNYVSVNVVAVIKIYSRFATFLYHTYKFRHNGSVKGIEKINRADFA